MKGSGRPLPTIVKRVTREQIHSYARASGDHNPLHLDEAFAARTPFGRPIAHGMLTLAFLSEMMTQAFGEHWLEGGRLKVRFRAPVYPGDQVSTQGEVVKEMRDKGFRYLECSIALRNQRGEDVVTGTATVRLPLADEEAS